MNKEEMIQMLKDNPIKIIKCGDIEIPVEYLKQTTVNVNGNDYIRLQQENKQLKDNWNKLKEYIRKNIIYDDVGMKIIDPSPLEDYMQELEQGSDSNVKD